MTARKKSSTSKHFSQGARTLNLCCSLFVLLHSLTIVRREKSYSRKWGILFSLLPLFNETVHNSALLEFEVVRWERERLKDTLRVIYMKGDIKR